MLVREFSALVRQHNKQANEKGLYKRQYRSLLGEALWAGKAPERNDYSSSELFKGT